MALGLGEGLGLFSGMVSAAKTLREGVRKLSGDIDQDMRNTLNLQIGELIDAMQDMRERHSTLLERVGELERENRQLREFEVDRENYVLETLAPNSSAYTHKTDVQAEQSKRYLCAHCFERKEKSILQFERHEAYTDVLKCHACGALAHKTADRGPAVRFAPTQRRTIFD